MFNRSRGTIWYRILQVLLIFSMIVGLKGVILGPEIAGISPADLYAVFPVYVNTCRAQSAIQIFICLCFFVCLVKYDVHMLMWCKTLILFNVLICVSQPMILLICYGIPFDAESIEYIIVLMISGNLIPFASYIYLKRRWGIGTQIQPPNTATFDPLTEIPSRLLGCTAQAERDRIIAEAMRGHLNPYTDLMISNEADWNTYLTMYYERKDAASAIVPPASCISMESVEPVSLSKASTQRIEQSAVSADPVIAFNVVTKPQAEPQPMPLKNPAFLLTQKDGIMLISGQAQSLPLADMLRFCYATKLTLKTENRVSV